MGTGPTGRKHRGRVSIKKYKKKVWLCRREKDLDQIQDELQLSVAIQAGDVHVQQRPDPTIFIPDDDLPGAGQFYCAEMGKHFINARALSDHKRSRAYKRRIKQLREDAKYTQEEAERAAGMTKEILPPAHASNEMK